MFIRWQKYRSVALWHRGKPPIKRVKAILVESVRIDGKPRQKHVAFIASYQDGRLDQISTRSTFWRDARQRLDRISNQTTPSDRSRVEAALAQRVPPTTAAEDAAQQRQADERVQRVGRASR
jgi:hypothetical protein